MQSKPNVPLRSRIGWSALSLVLIAEAIGGVAVLWVVIGGFFAASDEPMLQRVVLLVATLLAWAWVCLTLGGALVKRAGWSRGSALTIHVLLFAAGTGILQGIFDAPLLGWVLVLLALLGFISAVLAQPMEDPIPGEV